MRFIRVTREGHRALYDNTQCDFVGQFFVLTKLPLHRSEGRIRVLPDGCLGLTAALIAKRNTFGDV